MPCVFSTDNAQVNFFSAFDLHAYTKGASKAGLNLHSQSVQAINEELVLRRKQFKKAKLRWRISGGSRTSLGWIPLKASGISYQNGQIKYASQFFGLWDSYGLATYTFKTGCFTQDARGRWYICLVAELKEPVVKVQHQNTEVIGIDLGLKDFATLSNATKIEAQRLYRQSERKLAIAQRANKKQRVKAKLNTDTWLCYGFLQGQLQGGKHLDDGWRVGLGPRIGCRQQSSVGQLLVDVQSLYHQDSNQFLNTVKLGYQWQITPNNAIRLNTHIEQQQQTHWQSGELGWVRYF